MSSKSAVTEEELREKILSAPELILEDQEVMGALVAANERAMGANVVDLRGAAMARLETRVDRLEQTNRTVIAAAYENISGTNQIHRAVLRMLDPAEFEDFLANLETEISEILNIDAVQLVIEASAGADASDLRKLGSVLNVADPGVVETYMTRGRKVPIRQVALRQVQSGSETIYGENGDWIRSEACMLLDLGSSRPPGMLALGSEDPDLFRPTHGTDLLAFFAGVFERSMRRWLS